MDIATADRLADVLSAIGKQMDKIDVPGTVFLEILSYEAGESGEIEYVCVRVHWKCGNHEYARPEGIRFPCDAKKSPRVSPLVAELVAKKTLRHWLHIRESVSPQN